MENKDYIEFDFSYIDKYIDNIKSKIRTKCKLSVYNGFINKIYLIEKNENNTYKYSYGEYDDYIVEIDYEELIEEIMTFYKSSDGKITMIYRIFTNSINSKTNGEFRELWGDVLFVSLETLEFTSKNIDAENLSNIVLNLHLTEQEEKLFGKVEEYVFKDNNDTTIMGIDLI
jgi:hypothetical protein